jgi:hypothetical protein
MVGTDIISCVKSNKVFTITSFQKLLMSGLLTGNKGIELVPVVVS